MVTACGGDHPMCFAHDSQPPIAPIAGAAVEHRPVVLEAGDGNRLAAFHALAERPMGVGMLVLPDVRGLFSYYEELAMRFAEHGVDALALDYYGRTAGAQRRDASFEAAAHTERCTWAGLQADAAAGAAALREDGRVERLFAVGFCFGGRLAFLLSSLAGLGLAGVIGFYGWPVGAFRGGTPAPIDEAPRMRAPLLGIFGGADRGISADDVAAFERALAAAGVEHRLVTYSDAPHSFFDRKATEFADASSAAWSEVLAFVGLDGGPGATGSDATS
jgi:carboxymethylenebutenolidase